MWKWPDWQLSVVSLLVFALPLPWIKSSVERMEQMRLFLENRQKKTAKKGPAVQNYFTCSSNQLFLLKTVLLQPLTMLTCLSRNFTCLKGNFTILLLVCYLLCSPAWVGISPPSPVLEEISPFFGLFAIYYGHLSEKKFHLSDRKFHHAKLFTNTMLTCQEEI